MDFLVIAPVRYDADAFRRDAALANDLRHAFAHHHIGIGPSEASYSWRSPDRADP